MNHEVYQKKKKSNILYKKVKKSGVNVIQFCSSFPAHRFEAKHGNGSMPFPPPTSLAANNRTLNFTKRK